MDHQAIAPKIIASPVTTQCVQEIAKAHDIPLALIIMIMAQEGGQVGKYSVNNNNTFDYGPMQINTLWLKDAEAQNVSESDILWNGCLNVYVGSAILKKHLNATNGNIWKAIGNYHSKTPKFHNIYVGLVLDKVKDRPDIKKIIDRCNRYLMWIAKKQTILTR